MDFLRALKPKGTIPTRRLYHSAPGTQGMILEVLILLLNVFFVHAYCVEYSIKRVGLHQGPETPVYLHPSANLSLSVPWKGEARVGTGLR